MRFRTHFAAHEAEAGRCQDASPARLLLNLNFIVLSSAAFFCARAERGCRTLGRRTHAFDILIDRP